MLRAADKTSDLPNDEEATGVKTDGMIEETATAMTGATTTTDEIVTVSADHATTTTTGTEIGLRTTGIESESAIATTGGRGVAVPSIGIEDEKHIENETDDMSTIKGYYGAHEMRSRLFS